MIFPTEESHIVERKGLEDADGNIVAVFGIDLSLDWLSSVVNASHIYPSSYNIIISREGNIVVCPTESLIMRKSLQEATARITDTTARNENSRMLNGESGQATITDDEGEKNYV